MSKQELVELRWLLDELLRSGGANPGPIFEIELESAVVRVETAIAELLLQEELRGLRVV